VEKLIEELKRHSPDLKSSEISGVVYLLHSKKNLSIKELITLTGIPKETIVKLKNNIENLDKLPEITKPFDYSLLKYKDQDLEERLTRIRDKHVIKPKREYDQFFATAETSVSKAKILEYKGVLDNSHIALLGDDDLVSVVFSLLSQNHKTTVVFDIDKNLLSSIDRIFSEEGLGKIKTQLYDARDSVPDNYLGKFDVVITDPPYTKNGMCTFLSRAIDLLGGKNKYIFLYFGSSHKTPEKVLKIQEIINRMGLVVEDRIHKFARYTGAESLGNASSLYVLKTTPFTKTLKDPYTLKNIYTYQSQKDVKFPYVDHVVLKLGEVPQSQFSKNSLLKVLGMLCKKHKLKVVDTKITKFSGKGLSVTFILSNSNLLVHTWPEMNAVHIDLVTCKPIHDKEVLVKTVSELFNTSLVELKLID